MSDLTREQIEGLRPTKQRTDHWHSMTEAQADALCDMALSALKSERGADWISVEQRLPEFNTEVLVAFNETTMPATAQLVRIANQPGVTEWLYPAENNMDECPTVSHWLPLPLHPSEKLAARPAADARAGMPREPDESILSAMHGVARTYIGNSGNEFYTLLYKAAIDAALRKGES